MKTRAVLYPLGLALAGCLASALALPQQSPREAAESALRERDWEKAGRLLADALAQAKTGQDELLHLLAVAQHNAKQYDPALATLDKLVQDHPASALRMKALFRKGDVLADKKEFELAAKVYEAQVAALAAPERRKALAMVYVDAAREFLVPKDAKDPTFQANYAAAHKLLTKALELEALGADEEGVRADLITCELKANMPRPPLLKSCEEFLRKFPASARLDDVLFARGSAFREINFFWEARKSWLRIADLLPASKRAPEALLAAAQLYVTPAGTTADLEALRDGLPLLRRLAKDFAASEQGPLAAYLAGVALSQYEDLRDDARRELTAFADAHSKHERAPDALLLAAQLHRADLDDAKAVAAFEDFLKRFPESPRWPEVRQQIAEVRFQRVERAHTRKDRPALRSAVDEFLALHAADDRAPHVSFRTGESFKEEKKFKEAVESWLRTASRYPASGTGHNARYSAAEVMALELDDFENAFKELAKVGGEAKSKAAQLTATLQDKALSISSERAFRSGETPAVKLACRNVETVKFKLWSLDLQDYFEKKASTSGLQGLEVAVIAPDKEWEVSVKDFRRFKEMKSDVELPAKEPGAYVVTASAGALEAKTVVLVSDLAMIARAGRKGASAFVQDQKTGLAVADATLRTAADAKHLKAWTKETVANRLSFLAESKGHFTFQDLDVSPLPAPPERAPKALLLTDRTLYLPGDEVKVRVLLRDATGGAYAVPVGKKYRLVVSTPQLPFFEADLALSGAGLASASFRLPDFAIPVARLQVHEAAGKPLASLDVSLADAAQRHTRFEFLADDKPRFAADDAEITVVLRDDHGRPLPDRRVQVRLPGEIEATERRTGADGTFAVTLRETAQHARAGFARIEAYADGAGDAIQVAFLPRNTLLSFEESCRLHEVVPAGDTRAIEIKARRADDSPVATTFAWSVLRENEAGERAPVASGEVTTDAQGLGRFTVTPREGGLHRVRIVAKDADGLPVALRGAFMAVDDKEEPKLRLLSAADEFQPGAPMEFTVLSRLEKGLAYVTVEGETIEQTLPVTLEKGRTVVRLGAPPVRTRDFSVAVLMMKDGRFHADVRDFRLKAPAVKVEPEKKEYRPGEEAVVKVTARPGSEVIVVAAERVAAGIDLAAFQPGRPGRYFTGDSSAAAAFAGQTVQIDAQVLQAMERVTHLNQLGDDTRVMMDHGRIIAGIPAPAQQPYDPNVQSETLAGRRNLVARGGGGYGGKARGPLRLADPEPLLVASAPVDAAGAATFRFRLPQGWGRYTITAWTVDGSNSIATHSAEVKARAPVTVEFRVPDVAVEGEATSAVALLTNHSAQEQTVVLSFGGQDVSVKVAARSTAERVFPWTSAPTAVFALDGLRQERTVALRPAGPVTHLETGGAFTARTTLAPNGAGQLTVRVATGPAALLDGLAETRGRHEPLSDAAARVVAKIARHRHQKSDSTKDAVRDFAVVKAAGVADLIADDPGWPVLVYLADAEAKAAEFEAAPDGKMLKDRFARAAGDDLKALYLFALARGGEAQYGYVHRLLRGADALPPRGLACVALALQALGKPDEAKAALALLAKAAKDDHWEPVAGGVPDRTNTAYAVTALGAFAFAEADPANALLPKLRAWLLARGPAMAFERAMLALAMQSTPDKSAITELKVDGKSVSGFAEVAATQGVIEPTGAGTFYALARREVPRAPDATLQVKSSALWPQRVVDGVPLGPEDVGATQVVDITTLPATTRVAAGRPFLVIHEAVSKGPTTDYRIVELPVPTGLRARKDAALLVVPPHKEAEHKVTHTVWVYPDAPGAYAGIEVLPAGAAFEADRPWTAAERLGAGRVHFGAKRWKETREVLEPIFGRTPIHDRAAVEAARMLTYAAVELGEHETVVRTFEVLKEKSPAEVVPFDKVRAVGRAYAAMKEHERAMQVHAGTCDATFLQEANLPGALEELGRTRPAADRMKELLRSHPDTALNREMLFGFGQRLFTLARAAKDPLEKDARRLTRAEMLAEAEAALERHLAWYPADAEGDRVALSLGGLYLESQKNAKVDALGRWAAARFPKSKHLDSFDYLQAVALFAQRKFADSLLLCDRLETFDYGRHANPGPEVVRFQAALMKAQIFHAMGSLEKALENYKKVKDSSPDAARSIAFLEREAIAVPETVLAPLAKPAELELEYAGVAEASVRAYKVDLAVLAMRRKGLADAASVEVAGIRPIFEKTFKLDHPNAKRRERQKLALELKDPGAYLVGVKAGDFFASGLVLRSDLTMTVQDEAAGNVRVNVANSATGAFEEGVKVTILGTGGGPIASQKTDLRGIWESTVQGGLAVVVAEKGGHVALYRGQTAHRPVGQGMKAAEALESRQKQQQELLNDQIQELNKDKDATYWHNNMRQQRGVEVERTKK